MAEVDLAQACLVGNNLSQGTLTIHSHLGLILSQTQDADSLTGSCCSWPRGLPAVALHRQQSGAGSWPQQRAGYASAPHC